MTTKRTTKPPTAKGAIITPLPQHIAEKTAERRAELQKIIGKAFNTAWPQIEPLIWQHRELIRGEREAAPAAEVAAWQNEVAQLAASLQGALDRMPDGALSPHTGTAEFRARVGEDLRTLEGLADTAARPQARGRGRPRSARGRKALADDVAAILLAAGVKPKSLAQDKARQVLDHFLIDTPERIRSKK